MRAQKDRVTATLTVIPEINAFTDVLSGPKLSQHNFSEKKILHFSTKFYTAGILFLM